MIDAQFKNLPDGLDKIKLNKFDLSDAGALKYNHKKSDSEVSSFRPIMNTKASFPTVKGSVRTFDSYSLLERTKRSPEKKIQSTITGFQLEKNLKKEFAMNMDK